MQFPVASVMTSYSFALPLPTCLLGLKILFSRSQSEIKHVDASLKTLVQNNFYKFVIAGDTLKRVNTALTDIDGQLESVKKTLENVDELNNGTKGQR